MSQAKEVEDTEEAGAAEAKEAEEREEAEAGKPKDADARGRIAKLEESANQHSHVIVMLQCCNVAMLQCYEVAILQDKVTQLSTDFGYLVGEVSTLQSAASRIQPLLE
jgi:hypothetical protein